MEDTEIKNPLSKFSGKKLYTLGKEAFDAKNDEEANKYYLLAAEKGNADAMYALSRSFPSGPELTEEDLIAREWLVKAAEKGNVQAMFTFATFLGSGCGFRYNPWESTKWYLRAAKKGHINSMYYTGYNYLFGVGTRPNEEKGLEWLKKAAAHGSNKAIKELAIYYMECTDDAEQTAYWVGKAKKEKIEL